jgi:hypothetical protein
MRIDLDNGISLNVGIKKKGMICPFRHHSLLYGERRGQTP